MWTFCVASAPGGGEVWITKPFASSGDRRALGAAMQSTLKRREGERVLAQCPQPSADKVAVVNAQTDCDRGQSQARRDPARVAGR